VGTALLVGALAGAAAGVGGAAVLTNDTAQTITSSTSAPLTLQAVAPSGQTTVAGSTEEAATNVLPSVVKIYATSRQGSGSGSGIILTGDGEILTNNHVIELAADGGKIAVSFDDGTSANATIVGRDPLTDLAVIKASDVSGLKPATMGTSSDLQVGQQVVAVGAPFGLESTVTTGIVSALNRPVTTQGATADDPATVFPAVQTDAAINPGNSGGPLVDLSGHVVGIDSAIKTVPGSDGDQSGSIGLGFAIPVDDALPIVEQLREGDTPTHALIGVSVADASDDVGLPDGALVEQVDPGGAGDQAGIEEGAVITHVDDNVITDSSSLVATIRSYRPDDGVVLTVTSSTAQGVSTGDPETVQVTLGSDAN
jgi:putative serine protease PepD